MIGQHETRLGRLKSTGEPRCSVPGWGERKGVPVHSVCDEDPDFAPLPGYLGEYMSSQ